MGIPLFQAASLAPRALIWLASVSLLLPLPAHCAACWLGTGECPRCPASQTAQQPAGSADCCRQAAAAEAQGETECVHGSLPGCRCCARPVHRTVPSAEKTLTAEDMLAAVSAAVPVSTPPETALLATAAPGERSPAIPHRILHCSWLI